MKSIKKITSFFLSTVMMVMVIGMQVYAADGVVMFSDPQTKVGENVSVNLVVQSDGTAIGDVEIRMLYDMTALEFVGGNGITDSGNGELSYIYSGEGSETETKTTIEFRALKQGTASISITGQSASLYSGEELNLSEGSSVVTIDVGEDGITSIEPNEEQNLEKTDVEVTVNGKTYYFSESFKEIDIPDGFVESTFTYDGAERKFVENENGIKLGYLVDEAGKGAFFLYNEDDATFSPFVEFHISESTSIVLLDNMDNVELPKQYQKAELKVEDFSFTAWQDMDHDGYYAVYALNTVTGEKELYQYDTVDGTYQRLIMPSETNKEEKTEDPTALGKVKKIVNDNFLMFLIVLAVLFLILVISIIIVAIKLHHRNIELDDIYDEYGIDADKVDSVKKDKNSMSYDDYEDIDEEYLNDEYDAYYDEHSDYENDNYDEYEEEYTPSHKVNKKQSNQKNSKKDDIYNIDFIDL